MTIHPLRYHYQNYDQNQGDQPSLLLLHGFTGSTENWKPLIPHLTQAFKVVTVDLPGHGQTDAPADYVRYGMPTVAKDLVQLMADLGNDRFHLLGYSMGGRLALYLALHYPQQVSRLILESASPGLKTAAEQQQRRAFDTQLAQRIEQEGIEKFVDFWENISLWESQKQLTADQKSRLRQIRLRNNPAGLANSLRGMGTGQQPSLWGKLTSLHTPTLLITGEHDHKFCNIAADMQPHIPTCTHTTIPHAGHTVHLEQPADWLDTVQNFLI